MRRKAGGDLKADRIPPEYSTTEARLTVARAALARVKPGSPLAAQWAEIVAKLEAQVSAAARVA